MLMTPPPANLSNPQAQQLLGPFFALRHLSTECALHKMLAKAVHATRNYSKNLSDTDQVRLHTDIS